MTTYVIELIVEGKDRASGPLGNVSGALSNMGTIAGGILSADVIRGIANGIMDIGRKAFEAVGSMQALTMAMEAVAATELVNSGAGETFSAVLDQATQKGAELMGWLRKLSVTSPFGYETVAQAFQFNASMGQSTQMAQTTTKAILDFSSAVGLGQGEMQRFAYAMAQTGSTGKITAMDMRQFANSRFGLQQLNKVFEIMSQKTGVLIKDYNGFNRAIATGRVKVDDFYGAFAEMVDKGYGGAAERMINTIPGLMSNVQDIIFFTMNDLFGGAGDLIVQALGPGIGRLTDMLNGGQFQKFGEQVTAALTPAISFLGDFFNVLTSPDLDASKISGFFAQFIPPNVLTLLQNASATITDIATTISTNLQPVFDWLANNAGPAINDVLALMNDHWTEFDGAIKAVGATLAGSAVVGILASLGAALAAINWPLVLIVGAIGLLGAAWAGNWGNIQGVAASVVDWFNTVLLPTLLNLYNWFMTLLPTAMAVLETGWTVLQGIVAAAIAVIQPTWEAFLAGVGMAIQAFVPVWEAFKGLWASLQPLLGQLLAAAGAILLALLGIVVGVINGIINALNPLIQTIAAAALMIIQVVTGVIDFFVNFFNLLMGIFTNNTALIEQSWSNMGTAITDIAQSLFDGVVAIFSGLWDTIKGFIEGLVSGMLGFFTNLYNELIGHSIIPDMIAAIIGAFSAFVGQGLEIIGGLIEGIKGLFGGGTDWTEVGAQFAEGIFGAFQEKSSIIPEIVAGITTALTDFVAQTLGVFVPGITALITTFQGLLLIIQQTSESITKGMMVFIGMMMAQWQNQFIPAILNLAQVFRGALQNALQIVAGTIGQVTLMAQGATAALYTMIGAVEDLKAALEGLELPPNFTPGSPTPAEIGFRGIANAIGQLSRVELPKLQSALDGSLLPNLDVAGVRAAAANAGDTYNQQSRTIEVKVDATGSEWDEDKLAAAISRWEFFYAAG